MSLSTMFVTTTTEPFKRSSSIGLSDYCFFCGFDIYLPLENSPRFKAAYHAKTATNVKEDEELIAAGFEYVTERDGIKIYRKRKQKIAV